MGKGKNENSLSEKIKLLLLINFAGHVIIKLFVVCYYGIMGLPIILLGIIMFYTYKRRAWAIVGYLLMTVFMSFAAILGGLQVIFGTSWETVLPGDYLLAALYILFSILQIRILLLLKRH